MQFIRMDLYEVLFLGATGFVTAFNRGGSIRSLSHNL